MRGWSTSHPSSRRSAASSSEGLRATLCLCEHSSLHEVGMPPPSGMPRPSGMRPPPGLRPPPVGMPPLLPPPFPGWRMPKRGARSVTWHHLRLSHPMRSSRSEWHTHAPRQRLGRHPAHLTPRAPRRHLPAPPATAPPPRRGSQHSSRSCCTSGQVRSAHRRSSQKARDASPRLVLSLPIRRSPWPPHPTHCSSSRSRR